MFQDVVRLVLPRQRRQPPFPSAVRRPLPPGADLRHRQRRLRRLPDVRHHGQGAQRQRRRRHGRRSQREAGGLLSRLGAPLGGGILHLMGEQQLVFYRIHCAKDVFPDNST